MDNDAELDSTVESSEHDIVKSSGKSKTHSKHTV